MSFGNARFHIANQRFVVGDFENKNIHHSRWDVSSIRQRKMQLAGNEIDIGRSNGNIGAFGNMQSFICYAATLFAAWAAFI